MSQEGRGPVASIVLGLNFGPKICAKNPDLFCQQCAGAGSLSAGLGSASLPDLLSILVPNQESSLYTVPMEIEDRILGMQFSMQFAS